jgi:hypothetical protein
MSLEVAAKHLAAHGRGKDTELIHMDKGEIASLQKIAMANGGSLTINPHTGLPEAGFLSAMLPMIAGAGLMMIPGMQAMGAAGIVGALQTARTGSLQKGIMAGLGAYGGAGLAGSAGAAGASQVGVNATNAGASAAQGLEATEAARSAANIAAQQSAVPSIAATTGNVAAGATPLASSTQAFNAATQGGVNGLTMTPAESFGATNPTAGIQPAQAVQAAGGPQYNIDGMGLSSPTPTPTATPSSFADMNASERANAIRSGASFENAGNYISENPKTSLLAATGVAMGMKKDPAGPVAPDKDMGQRYSFTGGKYEPAPAPDVPTYDQMMYGGGNFGRQQKYFKQPTYTPISADEAKSMYHFAAGGPVEMMSNNAAIGANTMYPMANMTTSSFATPYQDPRSTNMMQSMAPSGGGTVDAMSGEPNMQGTRLAEGGIAKYGFGGFLGDAVSNIGSAIGHIGKSDSGGSSEGWKKLLENMGGKQSVAEPAGYQYNAETQQYEPKQMATGGLSDAHYNLGGYSDGGRLLRGPGDGVSDSIPAVIGKKQPARLADGEFVVPARIVSELGNGSTEAGARKLYAMLDRVQASRKHTVGKGKVAKNNRADKYLPA